MRKINAIAIIHSFLLGNIGLMPFKQGCARFIIFQGFGLFTSCVKDNLKPVAGVSVRQDTDASGRQDEVNLQGYLPSHYFTHLRFQAFCKAFLISFSFILLFTL